MPIEVVAILSALPGKAGRVVELLSENSTFVKEHEPGTLKYSVNTLAKSDDVVVLETYKDKESLVAHSRAKEFAALGEKLKGLLAKPLQVMILREAGGFSSRL